MATPKKGASPSSLQLAQTLLQGNVHSLKPRKEPQKVEYVLPGGETTDECPFDPNRVYSTTDYTLFRRLPGTPMPHPAAIRQMEYTMQPEPLIAPIMVNEFMEIIDGVNRFYALRNIGQPVYFIVQPGTGHEERVQLNGASKNWVRLDYLQHYITDGYPEYIRLKAFMDEYQVGLGVAILMFTRLHSYTSSKREIVKVQLPDGEKEYRMRKLPFEKGNFELSVPYEEAVEYATQLQEMEDWFRMMDPNNAKNFVKTEPFAKAFMHIKDSGHYDHAVMKKRFTLPVPGKNHRWVDLIDRVGRVVNKKSDSYAIELRQIYNHHNDHTADLYTSQQEKKDERIKRQRANAERKLKLTKQEVENAKLAKQELEAAQNTPAL